MINKNPFSSNRAEYMEDIWKFYVPFSDLNMDNAKPLIIEGGRGTGKTMFFLCNSWRTMLAEYTTNSRSPILEILKQKYIGLYYKVDPSFVAAMNDNGRHETDWESIFGTYLSAVLVRELVSFLYKAKEEQIIDKDSENLLSKQYWNIFRGNLPASSSALFDEVINDIEVLLNDIEDIVNNPECKVNKFRKTRVGIGFANFVAKLQSVSCFKDISVRIYIDEYESLIEWQQRIINTLIKSSNKDVIYNIGMKPMGMKTYCTLAAEEQLQETHDYKYVKLDDLVLADEYKDTVLKICKKRLELFGIYEQIKIQSTDIREYLGDSEVAKELDILSSKEKPKFYLQLRELIFQSNTKNINEALQLLCEDAPLINARLHLALLMRTKYAPTVDELVDCYKAWINQEKNNEYDKYAEWLHTAKNGLVFLIAKECHVKKMYYGWDTFIALSSGTIRYFLELCEQTINIALRSGFKWESPQTIDIDVQTRAAYYVSKKKVMEIESYAGAGRQLRIFAQCLGELFQDLHRNEKSTLSEPEQNHFSTDSLSHSLTLRKNISTAVQWSVLLITPSTKDKESIKTNILDYHLNKIYAPYFGISCLKKRKINLSSDELEGLFSGDIEKAQTIVKAFLKKYWSKSQKNRNIYEQISIFGDDEENEENED